MFTIKRDFLSYVNIGYLSRRKNDFIKFQETALNLRDKKTSDKDNIAALLQQYDAVICGSDQIWNPRLPDADICFFIPEGDGFKRIAYAASLGGRKVRGV